MRAPTGGRIFPQGPESMAAEIERALVWFRRDLRLTDNAALHHALAAARRVHCAFVFDREILDALPDPADRRVEFIWESAAELKAALEGHGGTLTVRHARAGEAIPALARELGVTAVFANHDYEPQAAARDAAVGRALAQDGIALHTFKDQVVFEKDEVLTADGRPYSVFTPYRNAWLKKLTPFHLEAYPVEKRLDRLASGPAAPLPALETMGFRRTNLR
jgi:deoxyribodipyrimidine photo-lyase